MLGATDVGPRPLLGPLPADLDALFLAQGAAQQGQQVVATAALGQHVLGGLPGLLCLVSSPQYPDDL